MFANALESAVPYSLKYIRIVVSKQSMVKIILIIEYLCCCKKSNLERFSFIKIILLFVFSFQCFFIIGAVIVIFLLNKRMFTQPYF